MICSVFLGHLCDSDINLHSILSLRTISLRKVILLYQRSYEPYDRYLFLHIPITRMRKKIVRGLVL